MQDRKYVIDSFVFNFLFAAWADEEDVLFVDVRHDEITFVYCDYS